MKTRTYTDYNDRFTTDARKLYDEYKPRGGSFRAWMKRSMDKLHLKEGVDYITYTIPGARYFNVTFKLTEQAGVRLIEELKSYIANQQTRKAERDSRDQSEPLFQMEREDRSESQDEAGEIYDAIPVEEPIYVSDREYMRNSFETLYAAIGELGKMLRVALENPLRSQESQAKKFLTIREFVELQGKKAKFETMQAFGGQVSKHCKEHNIPVTYRKSDAYGTIGAYPIQALEAINREYGFIE